MLRKSGQKNRIRLFLLRAVSDGAKNPSTRAASHFAVTRRYINQILRQLVGEGWLKARGQTRSRRYEIKMMTTVQEFPSQGSTEDRVWKECVKPAMTGLSSRALDICHYGTTEMVNNAIDHSEGDSFHVEVGTNPALVQIAVGDTGVGIFKKIMRDLNLEDEEHAALELSKGKLTTDPRAHTGEGIFFASRMFDRFSIASGRLFYAHTAASHDWVLANTEGLKGTYVQMRINSFTRRSAQAIFDEYTMGNNDPSFSVTHVPVGLVEVGEDNLISRSQAKRLMARTHAFRRILLDFRGVRTIGQAFADEVFRVWTNEHPECEVIAMRANKKVQRMMDRALAARDEPG